MSSVGNKLLKVYNLVFKILFKEF
ncbi:hypothetical protein SFB3_250G0, partial [Candidatus Arthromitus sp. SFB-3]